MKPFAAYKTDSAPKGIRPEAYKSQRRIAPLPGATAHLHCQPENKILPEECE